MCRRLPVAAISGNTVRSAAEADFATVAPDTRERTREGAIFPRDPRSAPVIRAACAGAGCGKPEYLRRSLGKAPHAGRVPCDAGQGEYDRTFALTMGLSASIWQHA